MENAQAEAQVHFSGKKSGEILFEFSIQLWKINWNRDRVSRSICQYWHKPFLYVTFQALNSKFTRAEPGLIWCDLHHLPNPYEIFQIGWGLQVSIEESRI